MAIDLRILYKFLSAPVQEMFFHLAFYLDLLRLLLSRGRWRPESLFLCFPAIIGCLGLCFVQTSASPRLSDALSLAFAMLQRGARSFIVEYSLRPNQACGEKLSQLKHDCRDLVLRRLVWMRLSEVEGKCSVWKSPSKSRFVRQGSLSFTESKI